MNYLPAFIDIRGHACLLVGGGEAAAKKAQILLRAGGRVSVVTSKPCAELARRVELGELVHLSAGFEPAQVVGQRVVIAASEDAALDAEVSDAARAVGVLVNVVDTPDLCSFIVPSLVDREPVLVAISTGGTAPVLGRALRARIEGLLPSNFGRVAQFASRFREQVMRSVVDSRQRRRLWEQLLDGPIVDRVLAGDEAGAERLLRSSITGSRSAATEVGELSLVEVPADAPDLLSLRAVRVMQHADVLACAQALDEATLDLGRRDAERYWCARTGAVRAVATCLARAARGERVVLLAASAGRFAALATALHACEEAANCAGARVRVFRCTACECPDAISPTSPVSRSARVSDKTLRAGAARA